MIDMMTIPATSTNLQRLADWLKVLAEPKRLLILNLLMEGTQCNCQLSDLLQMAPNLISHHLSVLCQAGLVDSERDTQDARWIYYSVNRTALNELNVAFGAFFDPARIQPRQFCGPNSAPIQLVDTLVSKR